MKHPLGVILGVVCGVTAIVAIVFNGSYMLFAPRKWFELPHWLAGRGTMRKKDYQTEGALLEVRLLGGALLAMIGYMVFHIFKAH